MMIDPDIEYRIIDTEVIAEVLEAYINHCSENLNAGCLLFLSDNLLKNLEQINALIKKDA